MALWFYVSFSLSRNKTNKESFCNNQGFFPWNVLLFEWKPTHTDWLLTVFVSEKQGMWFVSCVHGGGVGVGGLVVCFFKFGLPSFALFSMICFSRSRNPMKVGNRFWKSPHYFWCYTYAFGKQFKLWQLCQLCNNEAAKTSGLSRFKNMVDWLAKFQPLCGPRQERCFHSSILPLCWQFIPILVLPLQ